MSGETNGPQGPQEHIKAEDRNGDELFPAADFDLILDLPALLEPELKDMDGTFGDLLQDVRIEADNLATSHHRALSMQLRNKRWLKRRRNLQRFVTDELDRHDGQYVEPYEKFRRALSGLMPGEISYFTGIVNEGRDVTHEDYLRAGSLDEVSLIGRAFGKRPRLAEESEENFGVLREVADAYRSLILVETQNYAAGVLDMCLAFGDRRQINAAADFLRQLRNISCDPELGPAQKIIAQTNLNTKIAMFARNLTVEAADAGVNPALQAKIDNRNAHFAELFIDRAKVNQVLLMVEQGRRIRLYGLPAEAPEPEVPAEEDDLPSGLTVEVIAPGIPEAAEPEPDYAAEYGAKLSEVTGTASFRKFELLPTNEIKRRKLEEARAVLVKGEDDEETGETIVGGRSKIEVHRYISSVEFLRSFIPDSGDVAEGRQALDEAVAASKGYASRLKAVLDEAADFLSTKELANLGAGVPNIKELGDVVSYIKDDWETAAYVIKNYWPDGREAAEQLRQLLFAGNEPAELQHGQEVNLNGR